MPLLTESSDRRLEYGQWLDRAVFDVYRPANGSLIDDVLSQNISSIKASEDHRHVVGGMFFEGLPEPLRHVAIDQDPASQRLAAWRPERPSTLARQRPMSATAV